MSHSFRLIGSGLLGLGIIFWHAFLNVLNFLGGVGIFTGGILWNQYKLLVRMAGKMYAIRPIAVFVNKGSTAVTVVALVLAFGLSSGIVREAADFKNSHVLVHLNQGDQRFINPLIHMTDYDYKQIMCLAKNMYFEARGESDDGIQAVGHVTINRASATKFPDDICDVVYQARYVNVSSSDEKNVKRICQFSWVCQLRDHSIRNKQTWEHVYNKAFNLYVLYKNGEYQDNLTANADHYHADYVNPNWGRMKYKTTKIGKHIFYNLSS